jgi:hypothetical protein
MKRIVAALFALLMFGALSGVATAQASGPRLNHCIFSFNEAAVPDNDLASFNVYIGTTSGGPYTFVGSYLAPSPAGGASYTTPNMCALQSQGQKYAVVDAQDTAGNKSPQSSEVPFVIDLTAPPAVSNIKVQ